MFIPDYSSLLFAGTILCLLTGALLPLGFKEARWTTILSFGPMVLGSIMAMALSLRIILTGSVLIINSPVLAPIHGSLMELRVSGFGAFFIFMIGLVTLSVSIYSIGYCKQYFGKHSLKGLGFLANIFVLSMILVPAANDIFAFLVFWETMSLSSFFLVIYEQSGTSVKSGLTYIVMTHFGTAFITAAFLLLYSYTGSLSFDSFRNPVLPLPIFVKEVVLVLALIGFGSKAGLVPLHIWLPQAHPSAPSNVSALMSGVMIKVAIYGLALVTLNFVDPSTSGLAWLGMLMVIAGAVSSLIGVLYASVEHDLKRALAYHSVENIGIIVLGLGLSVVFMSYGLTALAALALLASMYHSLNHALFKSLLFMGAGSVISSTNTRDLNRMGGLARVMPWTSLLFLVGSIAIAGLPPLNGFVSEWLTMQALLSSYQVPNVVLQVSISFASIAFALTLGLALATFVKLFGISFLSKPRSEEAQNAKESPKIMIVGMSIIGFACVVLGILPFIATRLIAASFGFNPSLVSAASPFGALTISYNVAGVNSVSGMSMPEVVILMGSVSALLLGFILATSRGRKTTRRVYGTWDNGFGAQDERMEQTASSLSRPLRTVFSGLFRPHTDVHREYYSETNHYIKKSVRMESHMRDFFEERIYSPFTRAALKTLDTVRRIQTGKINSYLLYIMMILVLFLVMVAVTK
ncbi:MAG TPA: proton-conducting transporter membrane subunit [Nitrososphaerales archaeon]|nr:proton-conducting transporter membrane subunit [Nitrososphaerales archaeon]